MAQADGCYPRVNAGMLQSGQFGGLLVSIVGKVLMGGNADTVQFQTSDGGNITLVTDQMEGGLFQQDPNMVIEIIGSVSDDSSTMIVRKTSLCDPYSGGMDFFFPLAQ